MAGARCDAPSAGLSETGNGGAEAKYGEEYNKRILAHLDRASPDDYANWLAVLLARELGDVHVQYIWRFLRAQRIDRSGRKAGCQSTGPELVAKAADIVGLYTRERDHAFD